MSAELFAELTRAERLVQAHRVEAAKEILEDLHRTTDSPSSQQAVREALLETYFYDRDIESLKTITAQMPSGDALKVAHARLAYLTGVELHSHDLYEVALSSNRPDLAIRAREMLGKLFTDLHDLEHARDWLLAAVALARDEEDLTHIAAASGALAEVMFLGGHPLAALQMIRFDAALLSPGDLHRERLLVYEAHCLRQCGAVWQALQLYEEAWHAAELRGANPAWAIRGALWCEVLLGQDELPSLQAALALEPHSHSGAMARMAIFWHDKCRNDGRHYSHLRAEAAAGFAREHFLLESAWARGEDSETSATSREVEPPLPSVVDAWMKEPQLRSTQDRLAAAITGFEGSSLAHAQQWMGAWW